MAERLVTEDVCSARYEGILRQLKSMCKKLDAMHDCMLGNGEPGLKTRVALTEQMIKDTQVKWNRVATVFIAAIVGLVAEAVYRALI